jgi:hypothetical protein
MKLRESKCNWIARQYANSDHLGVMLAHELNRTLTEGESEDLVELLSKVIGEVLADYEFVNPERAPILDSTELWVEEHTGVSFKRPHGTVVYTVTGELQWHRYTLRPQAQPVVHRSSDGKTTPMTIAELQAMEVVTVTDEQE